jgi:2,4-dienoyl-CoA reductase-like NADH-dependent reductase (Old Yellow Enzyme family)
MSVLAKPLLLPCGTVLGNRIAKAAMTEGIADAQLRATLAHQTLYRYWSQSGAGLLLTGNVQIDHRVLERPGNVALEDDGGLLALRDWATAGKSEGQHLWMQISHAGRQAFRYITREPLGPSAIPVKMMGQIAMPRALADREILDFISRWAQAARWAQQAGFTGVQIHAAHGYLLSSFLSPLANRRNDRWGGSIHNRARFLLETVRAVRHAVGDDFAVAVKLNSADFQRGGFGPDDSRAVISMLNAENIDLLEISGGNYEQPRLLGVTDAKADAEQVQRTARREAYFLQYAAEVRELAKMPLMVTGGFRSRHTMEEAIAGDVCDVIGLGRPFCVANDFVRPLLAGEIDEVPNPEQAVSRRRGWYSPTSPSKLIQFMHVMGMRGYYFRQLIRIAHGQPVELQPSLLRHLTWNVVNELHAAASVRRARKVAADSAMDPT